MSFRHINCLINAVGAAVFHDSIMRLGDRNTRNGFTLLEAMIATMILGFVLASVLGVASQCARYLTDIRRTARSSQVLQQKMEDIRLLSWSELQAYPATFVDTSSPAATYSGTVVQTSFDSYNGTTTVARVTLTVTWKNQTGRVLTNTLSSLVCNGGLNKYIL